MTTNIGEMKYLMLILLSTVLIIQCSCQTGFPRQFQATLNISGLYSWQPSAYGVQQLLYDHDNLRVRIDVQGWQSKQNETYMLIYKPPGAEIDSVGGT
jgi:hypothetical protein